MVHRHPNVRQVRQKYCYCLVTCFMASIFLQTNWAWDSNASAAVSCSLSLDANRLASDSICCTVTDISPKPESLCDARHEIIDNAQNVVLAMVGGRLREQLLEMPSTTSAHLRDVDHKHTNRDYESSACRSGRPKWNERAQAGEQVRTLRVLVEGGKRSAVRTFPVLTLYL